MKSTKNPDAGAYRKKFQFRVAVSGKVEVWFVPGATAKDEKVAERLIKKSCEYALVDNFGKDQVKVVKLRVSELKELKRRGK